MACSCKKNRIGMARRKKGNVVAGVPVEKLVGIAGGAAAGKALNGVVNKVPTLQKYLGEGSQYGKYILPAGKILGGAYLNRKQKGMAADAGLGMMAVGGLELIESLFPSLNITGTPGVGNLTIDLNDQIRGPKVDRMLESAQGVAGHALDDDLSSVGAIEDMYDAYEAEYDFAEAY